VQIDLLNDPGLRRFPRLETEGETIKQRFRKVESATGSSAVTDWLTGIGAGTYVSLLS
jgi:hypothetical protein